MKNILPSIFYNRKRYPLSYRLLVYVIIISSFFALIATSVQLYSEYRNDVSAIQKSIKLIEDSYINSITVSLYKIDNEHLELELKGALKLQDIVYLQVIEKRGTDEKKYSVGDPNKQGDVVRIFPLIYIRPSGEELSVGTLTVKASFEGVYQRLISRVFVILTTNIVKVFFTSLCILLLIYLLITRHLTEIANYTKKLDIEKLGIYLKLNRISRKSRDPDEIDQIVISLNSMQDRIKNDIIKRNIIELDRLESEKKYRDLVDNAVMGIYQTNKDGRFVLINKKLATIFGYASTQEFLSSVDNAANLYKNPETRVEILKEIEENGVINGKEIELKTKNDQDIWVKLYVRSAVDKDGSAINEGLIEDISERVKLENQVRQSQKMEAIGALAGGIAHDFNNILSAIIGYSHLAFDEIEEEHPISYYLEQILTSSHRASELVKQILLFSRQQSIEPKPTKIGTLIKEISKLIRASMPSTIEIRTNISIESDLVLADPGQIHQVLMNLCTNAGYAMRETGGVLNIVLNDMDINNENLGSYPGLNEGSYLQLQISDTGPGIPEQIIDKIFDPFFSTKDRHEGTGLGLSVVHGIVASLKGIISVESNNEHGTRFNILLPKFQESVDNKKYVTKGSVPRGREHILFIDDESILVDLGKQILENLGYTITGKTSSEEALKNFQTEPDLYDLVISDLTMPDMTGVELGKKLMRIRSDIPIILCSGYSESIDIEDLKGMGFKDFLHKPLIIKNLATAIRNALD